MSERLNVSPEDLRLAGSKIRAIADTLKTHHQSAHDEIAALIPELGPTGSSALSGLLAHLESETQAHHEELVSHHNHHLSCANLYEETEAHTQKRFDPTQM
ncbi:type VII secretion target [Mycobacteroides abscessus]|uniref:type VII secretion target n=1 Tax=Mycobacteroides abscessus TaxID=36809 RepID=UPI0012FFE8CE|nr:type VII secretion target [Mycobacteroides abscessus]